MFREYFLFLLEVMKFYLGYQHFFVKKLHSQEEEVLYVVCLIKLYILLQVKYVLS